VRVALVNHNTSTYAELALRSLLALNGDVELDVTLIDNSSDDLRWATDIHSAFQPSTG